MMRARARHGSRRPRGASRAGASALLVGAIVATLGCGGPSDVTTADQPADFAAPPRLRATLVLEPTALEIGEVTVAKLAVVTPPGHRVLPVAPVELPGLWLLGIKSLPLEAGATRWVHRTEFRIRPRDTGAHTWPAMTVRVEGPDGAAESLAVGERAFEVTSVRDRFAERDEPFGLEREHDAPDAGFDLGLATGMGLSALIALAVLAARRALERRRAVANTRALAAGSQPAISLGEWSERELNSVLAALEHDPQQAASAGAQLLRVYMSRRYGGDALAATTEELELRSPSLAQRALWPDFIRILHNFDDVRFRPSRTSGGKEHQARTRRALEDSLRLVSSSRPDRGQHSAG